MASDVAGAKAAIYSRLADAPTFHPANASLFEDWTLQGGDIITVTSDSDSYSLPIYGMRMRWNGGTRVTVESTGNETRDAVEKMAQRETSRASNGYRSGIRQQEIINRNVQQLAADGSILYQAGLRLNAQGVLVYAAEDDNNLQSKLNVTSRAIEQEVTDRQNADTALSGRITVEAGRITQIVTAVGADGQVTSASIVTAINNQTGEGIVRLDADKIILDGNTTLKGMMTIDSGNLQVNGNVYAGLNGGNYFQGKKLRLVGASSSQGAQVEELTASDISDMIIKAEVSGNELRLWKKGDSTTGSPSLTFSKATSQSSGWSGNAVMTVSATQGATTVNTYTVGFGTSYNSHSIDLELTTNGAASQYMGSIIAVPVKIQQLTGSQSSPADRYTKDIYVACADLLETKTINANGTYTSGEGKIGLSSVTVSISPTLSGSWSSGTLTVSSSPAASSNLTRTLAQGTASWASDKKSVTVPVSATYGNSGQYSESTGWSVYVPTTTSYYAGSASVTLSNTLTWATTPASSISANQNAVTIETSGRVDTSGTSDNLTKTVNLYSQASTSGLTATFYVTHTDSSDSKRILKREVTCFDGNLAPGNIRGGVTIFGIEGTYAGTDLLESLTATANGTYLPSTGMTGFSSVTVNVTPPTVVPVLSGSWNSSVLSVSSNPAASADYTVGLGTNYGASTVDLELVTNGAVSQSSGSMINVPVKIQQLTGSTPVSRYTKTLTVACADLLETKSISANGTYTPSSGKIGLSSVTVAIAPVLSGAWNNSVLTVSSNPTAASNYSVGLGTNYGTNTVDLELTTNGSVSQSSGSTINVPVKVQQLTGSDPTVRYTKTLSVACADLLETKSVTANGTYTPGTGKIGLSSVTVAISPTLSGSWSSGTLTVSSSPSASSNLVRTLSQGSAIWASNRKSVTVPINATYGSSGQYSESTGWSVSLNTSTAYNAGSAAVTLSDTLSWGTSPSSSISANQNSVTISTSGRVNDSGTAAELTKTVNLYSQASTSGLTATFYVTHTDSTDAKRIIKRTATCSDANLVAANIKSGVSIFGVAGTYSDAVTISPSTAQTLDPGESVTISALKNGVSVASVSVSANTDSNLVAGNIKNGVTIFGVTGSYSGSSGTVVWPSPQTSYSYATFTANGESRTYTVVAPYTLNNANYAVLKRGDDVFAALNIQDSYNNVWNNAYIAGWNAYYNQTWYIPTDSGSGGQFKIPSAADSSGAWSYINWTRATNAYNDAAGSHTDKGSNWYCTITTDSSGNKTCRLSRTFGVAQSVPFTNGKSYHLYT